MTRKLLYLHLPKTAGSTLKALFQNTLDDFVVQANSADQLRRQDRGLVRVSDLADVRRVLDERGGLALHVDSTFDEVRRTTDFRSLAGLLFEPALYGYFEQFTIVTMFRNPFRRFLSEYAFVRRMKDADTSFLPDFDVSSLDAYLERTHPNPILHFLLECDLSRPREMSDNDLERVKEQIARYPIHVGIYERFDESIARFARVLGREFRSADVPVLNAGTPTPSVDPGLEAKFSRRNPLDIELYEYAVGRFDA